MNRIQAVKHVDAAGNALETARAMLAELRTPGSTFRSPGWILDPRLFDELARVELPEGPADSTLLLQGDGADGGMFLGYPYVVSPAAVTGDDGSPAMFFAADWGEAWIAAEPEVVRVRLSAAAAAGATQTQIQVVMRVNFALRRPEFFAVSP